MQLHSPLLQITRDGRTLAVADSDAVMLVHLRDDEQHRIEVPGVQAIAAFTDQVWVMTRAGVLVRFGVDGQKLDEQALTPDAAGVLLPTRIGAPAAHWSAGSPTVVLEERGNLVTATSTHDQVIPISGRRCARYAGARLTLSETTAITTPNGARITGGCVVYDGTSIAIATEHAEGRDLVVAALGSGRFVERLALPAGGVRLAERRGLALVREDARRIAVFDLRIGRLLGRVLTTDDMIDLAVDPDGKSLALRLQSGQLELSPLTERIGRLPISCAVATGPVAQAPSVPEVSEPPAAVEASPEEETLDIPDELDLAALAAALHAFEPRAAREPISRATALESLEHEIRSVTLWALLAVANAWNTRQLSYGNEGTHPFEHEVAAIVGMNEGFAPVHVDTARAALAAHEEALADDDQHRSASTPIGQLAAELGLSATAIDVLLVIAAPSLHGQLARLMGILGNDRGRELVDEELVCQVLEHRITRHDVAAELHPHAPLLRLGVVDVTTARPRPFAGLQVDPIVLSRLRAESIDLGPAVTVPHTGETLDELELAPQVLSRALEALKHAVQPARIAVFGPAGAGRRTLLGALAREAARALGVIDATLLPRDAERFGAALQRCLRRARLAGLIPVIRGLELATMDRRDVAEIVAAHPGPLAVIGSTDAPPPFPLDHVRIELPPLTESQRGDVWTRTLARSGHWLQDAAGLASRYRISPGTIRRAAAAAVTSHEASTPCDGVVEAYLRNSRDLRLASHARRIDRLATWSDLVLPSDVMDSLRELVGRVRHRRKVYELWGMGRRMLTSRGLTALFQGQPGTGKTLVAGVIARELGLDLYQVDLSKLMSKWIGETERNLASLFDAAEDGQVILLFDEADSLFAKRTEVRSSNDRYANLEVNYLLQRLDSFEGIAILTTNHGGSIDPAFKRRLSFRLSFPFPDEETRAALWRSHLPRELPRAGELTFDVLARKYQLSGGDIRNACVRAAFLAAQENTQLQQTHLERAVALEFAEIGKLSSSGSVA